MPLRLRQEIQEVSRRGKIEQFSNSRAVSGIEQGGFFLRKKPLSINGLPLQQLENCYNSAVIRSEYSVGNPRRLDRWAHGVYPNNRCAAQDGRHHGCKAGCVASLWRSVFPSKKRGQCMAQKRLAADPGEERPA